MASEFGRGRRKGIASSVKMGSVKEEEARTNQIMVVTSLAHPYPPTISALQQLIVIQMC